MSNFKIWIDNPIGGTNVVAPSTFEADSQRQNGFKAGTPASSILINTALRQSNLITTALMETIGSSANDLSVLSTLDDVKSVINGYMLNSTSRTVNFTQASSRSNLTSGETLGNSLGKISKYISDLDNSSIVGCQASNWANYAKYASSDTSKGTIEARLTALGFKEGSIDFAENSEIYTTLNKIRRQGNYVIFELELPVNTDAGITGWFTLGNIICNTGNNSDLFPSKTINASFGAWGYGLGIIAGDISIDVNGKVEVSIGTQPGQFTSTITIPICIGYEAQPLEAINDPSQDDPDGLIPDHNDIDEDRREENGDDEFFPGTGI